MLNKPSITLTVACGRPFASKAVFWAILKDFEFAVYCFYDSKSLKIAQKTRGDSHMKRAGTARRKFWIKPLKETNLGVAQPFFDP